MERGGAAVCTEDKKRMKGAIFDVDGTLIDSMDMWMHFGSSFVRSYGIEADDSLDLEIRYYSL